MLLDVGSELETMMANSIMQEIASEAYFLCLGGSSVLQWRRLLKKI